MPRDGLGRGRPLAFVGVLRVLKKPFRCSLRLIISALFCWRCSSADFYSDFRDDHTLFTQKFQQALALVGARRFEPRKALFHFCSSPSVWVCDWGWIVVFFVVSLYLFSG